MPAHAHVQHGPPPPTEEELGLARFEDDGAPLPVPSLSAAAREAEWLRVGAELTARIPELAARKDVVVTCLPRTRAGAQALFLPDMAAMEVATSVFAPLRPAEISPARSGDEEKYPAAWGAVVHESAHAAHSRWSSPAWLRGTAVDAAGDLLEESRAEAAHLARRPHDRRWLRACVARLVMPDFPTYTPPTRWAAAYASGLILARRDAGILDDDETRALNAAVSNILGSDLLATLAGIWQAAHRTADTDGDTMLDHARAWCTALGQGPNQPAPNLGKDQEAGRDNESGGSGPAGGEGLEKVVARVVQGVAASEAAIAAATVAAEAAQQARAATKKAQAAHKRQAATMAKQVFAPGQKTPHVPDGDLEGLAALGYTPPSPLSGTRSPLAAEKSAAGQLARALRNAAHRERVSTQTSSAAPPGRLNMRGALARDAQAAAGATPTARPWRRTHHRTVPSPPLRVGIAVDVSGSMRAAEGPIASAAWILARATALTDPDSRVAAVAFDLGITAINAPGRASGQVTKFQATGIGHSLAEALDILDAGVDLSRPGAARLAVIASDGDYGTRIRQRAAERIAALRKSGCAVLWLTFAPRDPDRLEGPLSGATHVELTDPADAVAAISKAATAALTAAP
ncbi:VWA domain-containing protein [Streptomyces sp. CA-250714]|uniref:VWA domain-containing protein n=1 Tax=Streptomyces sp. CA-250714 TaxID=3240060 RepID=UPI003D9309CB